MDFNDDEPRKAPKPVAFSQNSPLNPVVPEVSLILQESSFNSHPSKNDSFSGTEFQSYNAWRWKNMNLKETKHTETDSYLEYSKFPDCCIIKDQFSSSDIEKRKNEILYGPNDEPRRPLPPRLSPAIPELKLTSFSDLSFSNVRWQSDDEDLSNLKIAKQKSAIKNKQLERSLPDIKKSNSKNNDSKDLYRIISDQNKQISLLQKQIEQLLKSQEVKEKQIEQLLKSQETKENKIEQLLQSQSMKEKQVEQLLKSQEKKEKQLEQLMKSQEVKEKQRFELLKKINEIEKKEVVSTGTMAKTNVVDESTNTSFDCYCKNCSKKDDADNVQKRIFQKGDKESNTERNENSLSLNLMDIPTIQEHMPTPQSSIHIDIQDYKDSSDSDSDDSSKSKLYNSPNSIPLGYTFYNNVLTQVKDILENSNEKEKENQNQRDKDKRLVEKNTDNNNRLPMREYNFIRENKESNCNMNRVVDLENVRKTTVQHFQAWGNGFDGENMASPERLDFDRNNKNVMPYDSMYYPKFDHGPVKEMQSPTDISLKMNALAMKYLKQEQISQYETSQLQQTSRKPDVTIYNVTNLSIGTMRYLERHRILPNEKEHVKEKNSFQDYESPGKLLQRRKKQAIHDEFSSTMGNILDITALNQQPKLL